MQDFLDHMENFCRLTALNVCSLPSMRTSKVYVESGTSGRDLVEIIRTEFGMGNETVELYKERSLSLSSLEHDVTRMDFFIKNSADNPLVVIDKGPFYEARLSLDSKMKIPKTLRLPVVKPSNSPEDDAKAIEKFAAAVWMMRRRVEDISGINHILGSALTSLMSYVKDNLSKVPAKTSFLLQAIMNYQQNMQEGQDPRVEQMSQVLAYIDAEVGRTNSSYGEANCDKANSNKMKSELESYYNFCMSVKNPIEDDPSVFNEKMHRFNNLKKLYNYGHTMMENFRKGFIKSSSNHYQNCTNLLGQVQQNWLKLERFEDKLKEINSCLREIQTNFFCR